MLFQHSLIETITSGRKTQTRRPFRPTDQQAGDTVRRQTKTAGNYRVHYVIGQSYAVQPGRGKPGIIIDGKPLRIELKNICLEDVRTISEPDAIAEGFAGRLEFWQIWANIYEDRPTLTKLNNLVERLPGGDRVDLERVAGELLAARPLDRYQAWALTFKVVK